MNGNPLSADLDRVLDRTRPLWEELRGNRIFVTGGTGFFGCWILETFAWANERLKLRAQMVVLTRNPDAFRAKAPHLADRADIRFHSGDVKDFAFPAGEFSHVIHAATESNNQLWQEKPMEQMDVIVGGTLQTLYFALRSGVKKILLTSSGAVYGPQPADLIRVPEDFTDTPGIDDRRTPYGSGKRTAELLFSRFQDFGLQPRMARCFAFVGPYLPLDAHFAIGNFIRDALAGGLIRVNGDGTPFRSYLYAGDLVTWLWTILFRGTNNRPYNVGSGDAVTIAETAAAVAKAIDPNIRIDIAKKPEPGRAAQRYVPDVSRAAAELQLEAWTPLEDAIRATAQWHRQRSAG